MAQSVTNEAQTIPQFLNVCAVLGGLKIQIFVEFERKAGPQN